jgi:hypothetical protein
MFPRLAVIVINSIFFTIIIRLALSGVRRVLAHDAGLAVQEPGRHGAFVAGLRLTGLKQV